jgi:hypothetical protein
MNAIQMSLTPAGRQTQPCDIEELLQSVSVMAPGQWENDLSTISLIKDWYAVCTDDGIIAYFGEESDAFRFRLDYINRILNP